MHKKTGQVAEQRVDRERWEHLSQADARHGHIDDVLGRYKADEQWRLVTG